MVFGRERNKTIFKMGSMMNDSDVDRVKRRFAIEITITKRMINNIRDPVRLKSLYMKLDLLEKQKNLLFGK